MTGKTSIRWLVLIMGLHVHMGTASAQSAADKAAADALFGDAKRLFARGEIAAACDKFDASYSRFAQLGTQLALASCYEKQGRLASAIATFRAAARTAAKAQDKRQKLAEDRAAALAPRLSKMSIVVIANRVEGLEIRRDGAVLPPAELGSAVPVDPGEHTVEASAPGRVPWSIKVSVPPTPGVVDVPVPALEKATSRPSEMIASHDPDAEPDAPSAPRRNRRLLAYAVGGGGAVVVGASLVFGALASAKWSDSQAHCMNGRCDQTGVDLAGSASTFGNLSTGAFVVGVAAVGAGAYLLLTSGAERESRPASALRVVPNFAPAQVGVIVQGGF